MLYMLAKYSFVATLLLWRFTDKSESKSEDLEIRSQTCQKLARSVSYYMCTYVGSYSYSYTIKS